MKYLVMLLVFVLFAIGFPLALSHIIESRDLSLVLSLVSGIVGGMLIIQINNTYD